MSRIWKKQDSRYLARYRIFDLREDICVSPRTGQEHPFYILETRDWINIIAQTPEGQFVFVRQFRFGTGEVTLELPGGLVDPTDASPLEAARRELQEETGFDSDELIPIGSVRPNPAIQNNTCHLFYACNAIKKFEQSLDACEDIAVELFTRNEAEQMIKEGVIDHCLVLNAFYLLELWEKENLR